MYRTLTWLTVLGVVGCGDVPATQDRPASRAQLNHGQERAEETSMVEKVVRTEAEWKERLTPEQYYVLREQGTEPAFRNELDHHFQPGTYACAGCGQELFDSETKFNSGCGWPAFYAARAGDRVQLTADRSHGMARTEVTCARCDSHLGHVFDDAPQTPTGQRYCINSTSLTFEPAETGKPSEQKAP